MTEIERQLQELDRTAVFPTTPDLAAPVLARIADTPAAGPRPRPQPLRGLRLALALVLAIVGAGGVLLTSSPGARSAILDLLGLQGARIERGQPEVRRHTPLRLGREVSLAQARRLAGFAIAIPSSAWLGPPVRVGFDASVVPGGQVSLAWTRRLPRPKGTDPEAIVLTQTRAGTAPRVTKTAPEDTRIEPVDVNGSPGYWLAGAAHQMELLAPDGNPRPDTARLAGPTLIWEHGELLLRLEGVASKAQALAIARSIP
jgi:hypothetical protein